MNKRRSATSTLFSMIFAIGFVANLVASSGITNLIVRQRWPWSQVVDIDFVLTGTNSAPVRFWGQYEGVGKFELLDKDMDRNGASGWFAPGPHHITWDPAKAGLGENKIAGFSVTADVATYLVLDLSDGSYSYMAEPPEGGWLQAPEYFKTKMVFRRIPAGTKQIGLNDALRDVVDITANYSIARNVTMSSDYYLTVYPTTKGQHDFVVNEKDVSAYKATYITSTYDALRGSVDDDGIDWPKTMYSVKGKSVVDRYRNLVARTFPADWKIDLPTASQWEYACRAETPDDWLWSVGGTKGDSKEKLGECLGMIATWGGNVDANPDKLVGQHNPNGWGLYDMVGLCGEWNLDWCISNYTYYKGEDPVGPESSGDSKVRVRRSVTTQENDFKSYLTTFMKGSYPYTKYAYRLCIHLKPIERQAAQ